MNVRFRFFPVMVAALCLPVVASAANMLGLAVQYGEENIFNLVSIDSSAQSLTRLGELSASGPDIQLTPDGTTLVVVTTNGSVYRFSATDGSDIGSASISFPPDAVSEVNANTATALEYVGNVLYAAFDRAGPETDPGYLGTLNPVTGATTGIGLLTGMNAPTGGLAYYNSTMYAISAANSVFSELYTVNPATGAATFVANITLGGEQVEAMTALEIVDGVAYTKSNDDTGGTDEGTLYSLDLSTGELTAVFDMDPVGTDYVISLTSETAEPATETEPVPQLGFWGVAILVGLLAVLGVFFRRRMA